MSQVRQFASEPVPEDVVRALLEAARWTGSSRNVQPWHFVVIRDRATLAKIAGLRPPIGWVAGAPLGIAIVMDAPGHDYDEGRLTERILTAATLLGYGGGVAWFGNEAQEREGRRVLGIPDDRAARQIIAIGRPKSKDDPRSDGPRRGRRPLRELVSFEHYEARDRSS